MRNVEAANPDRSGLRWMGLAAAVAAIWYLYTRRVEEGSSWALVFALFLDVPIGLLFGGVAYLVRRWEGPAPFPRLIVGGLAGWISGLWLGGLVAALFGGPDPWSAPNFLVRTYGTAGALGVCLGLGLHPAIDWIARAPHRAG